jgi:hypothetical protein
VSGGRVAAERATITVRLIVEDNGRGWLVTATFPGPDLRDLIATAMANHERIAELLPAVPAAGLSSGRPSTRVEALPLTDKQYEGMKGTVEIW